MRDLAFAFDVGRSRLQADDVGLLQLQLRGVFDGDDALVGGMKLDRTLRRVVLPDAGAAGDHDVQAGLDAGPRKSSICSVSVPFRIRSSAAEGRARTAGSSAPARRAPAAG